MMIAVDRAMCKGLSASGGKMKINVLSATGQIGRKVVMSLLDQGASAGDLAATVRNRVKAQDLAELGVEVHNGDYEDPDSLRNAFQGTETLVLIPTTAPVEPRIQQHFNAVEAAKNSGVKRIMFASLTTAGFFDSKFLITPFFMYAESKLRLSGLDWTILRNNLYLDPIADWVPELVEMKRLPYPVKRGRAAYVSRDDLARATAAACINTGHSNKLYELSGSHALSMEELADTISRVTDQTVTFDSVTEEEFAQVCREGKEQVSDFLIEILTTLYRAVDNEEFENVTDHVEKITGSPPETAESYLHRVVGPI
jgi:NAD(P)H dehydrogenase (quinone)